MLPADQPYSLMKLTRLPAVMANLGYPSAVDPVKTKGSLLPLGSCGYGSIPINTIFRGMSIHLPAILMFTRGTRF